MSEEFVKGYQCGKFDNYNMSTPLCYLMEEDMGLVPSGSQAGEVVEDGDAAKHKHLSSTAPLISP